jgi:transposase InsO family protein
MGWSVHQIARRLRIATATVYWIAKRWRLNRLSVLQPDPPPVIRYERERPGELVHIDIKKLRRIGDQPGWRVTGRQTGYKPTGTGYDHIHVAIDDRTRLTFAMAMPDEKTVSCITFMKAAKRWYTQQGIQIERIMTDNGTGYKTRWKIALATAGIMPRFTRPYRPQTNGKAERMIQTLLREWAYNQPYQNNAERLTALSEYLNYYNHDRAHTALKGASPHERAVNDLLKINN